MLNAVQRRASVRRIVRPILVPVSPGELLDKISILEIKRRRIRDAAKQRNVRHELAALQEARRAVTLSPTVARCVRGLRAVNKTLWSLEDKIRRCEAKHDFGPGFIRLARSIYQNNDVRAQLKRRINDALGSPLVEEKSLPVTRPETRRQPPRVGAGVEVTRSNEIQEAERRHQRSRARKNPKGGIITVVAVGAGVTGKTGTLKLQLVSESVAPNGKLLGTSTKRGA